MGKKVIITGGGTGGHIFPGIAVARELSKRPEVSVLYVGKEDGPESKWVPDAGFEFAGLGAVPFPRFPIRDLFWPKFLKSLVQAHRVLTRSKAEAIFSTGGYVSVPVSLMGALRGVPVGLFEPNLEPGLAAKLLGFFAKKVFVGFEGTMERFAKGRVRWTGIPIREEILSADKTKAREAFGLHPQAPTLLMLGGSQGARALNQQMADVIQFLGQGSQELQVIMMTGWNDYRRTVDQLEKCPLKVVLRPFISNIHEAYAAADLVVARAGAMTCAEILGRGLPSLLIPYPHASGHQEKNARALEKAGSAVVILEKDLNEEGLTRAILGLLADKPRLASMGRAALGLAKPAAAARIVEELLSMGGEQDGERRG